MVAFQENNNGLHFLRRPSFLMGIFFLSIQIPTKIIKGVTVLSRKIETAPFSYLLCVAIKGLDLPHPRW